ncbi:MAG: TIGR02757 family protein [Candidatus Riflebacteria bacterium]|nr:TIGR02757 family protein [Candidatus Riflebacteria bacterium]
MAKIRESLNYEKEIARDPLSFPRSFLTNGRETSEIEAIALFSASLAYGRVELFMGVISEILEKCNGHFLKLITGKEKIDKWPGYRLSSSQEIKDFALSIGKVIQEKGGIRKSFLNGYLKEKSIKDGFIQLRNDLLNASSKQLTRGFLHLVPDPGKGGAQKRWSLFLRWMVRENDGLDLGLWKDVKPSELVVPIDRHIGRICRALGFTQRKSDDWKTAIEITEALRQLSPNDPLVYDFPLCHLGISKNCEYGKTPEKCRCCELKILCQYGKNITGR